MSDAQIGVILAFIFGVIFVTALLAIVIFIPNPTLAQFEIIRIILALAAGGVAAMIPGFLNLKLGVGSNLALRAGGALAVFATSIFILRHAGFHPPLRALSRQPTDQILRPSMAATIASVFLAQPWINPNEVDRPPICPLRLHGRYFCRSR